MMSTTLDLVLATPRVFAHPGELAEAVGDTLGASAWLAPDCFLLLGQKGARALHGLGRHLVDSLELAHNLIA